MENNIEHLDYQIEKFNLFARSFQRFKVRLIVFVTVSSLITGAAIGAYFGAHLVPKYDKTIRMLKSFGLTISLVSPRVIQIYAKSSDNTFAGNQQGYALLQVKK